FWGCSSFCGFCWLGGFCCPEPVDPEDPEVTGPRPPPPPCPVPPGRRARGNGTDTGQVSETFARRSRRLPIPRRDPSPDRCHRTERPAFPRCRSSPPPFRQRSC